MSLQIDTVVFDWYNGPLLLTQKRVSVFSAAHTQYVGSRLLPAIGQTSTLSTKRYQATATNHTLAAQLDAMKGSVVAIAQDGLDFASVHSVKFLVLAVDHQVIDTIAHAVSYGRGALVNLAPAGRVVTQWTLQAVPAT